MSRTRCHVLLIEDNPGDARLAQVRLSEASSLGWDLPWFDLTWINNLTDSLLRLEAGGFDAVLTDLDLPDSHAGDTFATLRERFPSLPIVVLTGREDEELALRSVRAGAQDYLFKAEATGTLLAHAIRYAIERQQIKDALRQARDELECRVAERTAALVKANADLQAELAARQRAEALLNATERLTKVGGWVWNVREQTMFWTKETYHLHGFSPEEILSGSQAHIERSLACYDKDDHPIVLEAFRRCIKEGQPYDLEFPFTSAKGRRLWIRTTAKPILEQGVVVSVIGNIMDITERVQAEQELRANERKYRRLVEQSLQGLVIAQDNPLRISFASQPMQGITGYTPAELIRMTPQQLGSLIHPEDRASFFKNFRNRLAGQDVTPRRKYRIIHKSGDVRWIELYSSYIEYEGAPATQTVFLDVTEQVQAKLEEKEDHER